ncbi:MAG: 30S ribosomal protein S18 [Planctomycetes bacterium]|nr:30S ribosomal protein S18 [Planctomycetota bacterium]
MSSDYGKDKQDFHLGGGRCRYCAKNAPQVDYKDINTLQKFMSPQGKLFDRKRLGNCAKPPRAVSNAVKRARFLGLLRYSGKQ